MQRLFYLLLLLQFCKKDFKGATKSYFTQYFCVVIILFDMGFCRSVFSTICFRKLVFHIPGLSVFFVESNVLNEDIKTAALKYVLSLLKKVLVAM